MEEKAIRITAGMLLGVTVLFSLVFMKLPDVRAWALQQEAVVVDKEQEEQLDKTTLELNDTEIVSSGASMQLRLTLPEGVTPEEVGVKSNYLTQTFKIEIPHTDDSYFESHPITGSSDHIEGLSYAQGKKVDIIEITTDEVYELATEYDGEYFYLDFVDPHELYEYVVVIDAGHGGNDSGAEKSGILEKDIDLAIVLELKKLLDAAETNIKVYYTRTTDTNPSYERRVGLANKCHADLFISIHNNSYKQSSKVKGTAVMYSQSHEGDFTSKRLAQICLDELTSRLGTVDKGIMEGDQIHIIRNSKVPVALIEVGFMTNREELKLLNSEDYQEEAAKAVYEAIFKALEEATATE